MSCSAKANEVLAKNAEFQRKNPQEIQRIAKIYHDKNPNSRYFEKDEFSPFRYYLNNAKRRLKHKLAKNKVLESNLTLNDIKTQWDKQNGICPYTNKQMSLVNPKGKALPEQASLDRIDSSKGYVQGNVEFVCLAVNYAKNNFSREQMINFFNK